MRLNFKDMIQINNSIIFAPINTELWNITLNQANIEIVQHKENQQGYSKNIEFLSFYPNWVAVQTSKFLKG